MSHKNRVKQYSGWGEKPISPREIKAAANRADREVIDDLRSDAQIEADEALDGLVKGMDFGEVIEEFLMITPDWTILDMSVPIGLITANQYKTVLIERGKELGFSMEVEVQKRRTEYEDVMPQLIQNMDLAQALGAWRKSPYRYFGEIQAGFKYLLAQDWREALETRIDSLLEEAESRDAADDEAWFYERQELGFV
jgi:hypothetical protein